MLWFPNCLLSPDAQATRQLQQASRDHAAELNSTVVALWHSWAAENRTQQQLQQQELLVDQANRSLALLWRERMSLMANLSQASSCQQIGAFLLFLGTCGAEGGGLCSPFLAASGLHVSRKRPEGC